jgi:zinc transporter 7
MSSGTSLNAFTATLAISLLPNLLLFIIPGSFFSPSRPGKLNYQNISLLFAAGGLFGDVFIHTIPDLLTSELPNHPSDNTDSLSSSPCSNFHGLCKDSDMPKFTFETFWAAQRPVFVGIFILLGFTLFVAADRVVNYNSRECEDGVTKSTQIDSISLSSAILNLIADSMHNFTDGLALGTSFSRGNKLALATMLSVMCHEIPHEIGDMAMLMRSGYS